MADILQEFTIKAPRERVFEAMATPEELARWWTKSATGEAKENAEFTIFCYSNQFVTKSIPLSDWNRIRNTVKSDSVSRFHFYSPGPIATMIK